MDRGRSRYWPLIREIDLWYPIEVDYCLHSQSSPMTIKHFAEHVGMSPGLTSFDYDFLKSYNLLRLVISGKNQCRTFETDLNDPVHKIFDAEPVYHWVEVHSDETWVESDLKTSIARVSGRFNWKDGRPRTIKERKGNSLKYSDWDRPF